MYLWQYFGCFQGVFGQIYLCLHSALYHSSMLQFRCLKLVSKSNLVQPSLDCGLQYSSYFPHIVTRVSSFEDRFQDTYWSMPQSPTPCDYLLALLALQESCKFAFQDIFTFKVPFKKSVIEMIIYCPIHMWTFNIGHIHACQLGVVDLLDVEAVAVIDGGEKIPQDPLHGQEFGVSSWVSNYIIIIGRCRSGSLCRTPGHCRHIGSLWLIKTGPLPDCSWASVLLTGLVGMIYCTLWLLGTG